MQTIRTRPASTWSCAAAGALLLLAGSGPLQAQNWNNGGRDYGGDYRDEYRHDDYRRDERRDDQRWEERRGDSRDGQGDVTELQKRACRPDVFRLCSWHIPNREAITACLHNNINKLNPDCRAVMEGRLR